MFRSPPVLARSLLCPLILSGAWASELHITGVEVNDQSQPLAEAGRLALSSSVNRLRIVFTEVTDAAEPAARLRFRLEGIDRSWRDLPVQMRALLLFAADPKSPDLIGNYEFPMTGETPGWRGAAEVSRFAKRQETVTVPPRAAWLRVAFLSHGGENGLGEVGIDDVTVRVDGSVSTMLHLDAGGLRDDLQLRSQVPQWWMKEGAPEMSVLRIRPLPVPHPILVLHDDDPRRFGNWALRHECCIPVAPGDRVTLAWSTAHSIGGAGPGVADYGPLAPGTYQFRLAAARANGEPTGVETVLAIQLLPPFHRRPEFWLILIAVLAAGAAWIWRFTAQRRIRRRLDELERRHAMERERERIARDLHDHIGAGLTEIAMQSDWVCDDLVHGPLAETRQRVERIRQSATDLARSVDEIVWAVNPENDTLKRFVNYLTQCTAQFLEAADLRVRFDIPQELPQMALAGKVRHDLFLVVREALNNTVKHAHAGLVRLEVHVQGGRLHITIEDDGCGFDPAQGKQSGTHEGLLNMQRRMTDIGGTFALSNRTGGGVRLALMVPVSASPDTTAKDTV